MSDYSEDKIKHSHKKSIQFDSVTVLFIIATIILFCCSAIRHILFHSTAFELGIYDQVAYLISQGKPPISSFLNIHHLGNHAAWAMYPVSLFYWIYPSVYWLLFIQAISLALGVYPTWGLARQAGLNQRLSIAVVMVYLLYPLIFNINLFDFHPEVMAVPALLGAILAAKLDKMIWFCLAIIWILGCKDALTLTVAPMGFWLLFFEKKRKYGLVALLLGMGWFIIAIQGIIPYYKDGEGPGGVGRYLYLGESVYEIILNLFLKPYLILGRILSFKTLEYFILLFSPVILWLSPQNLAPLIVAIPILAKNILSNIDAQRDLIHQYSLPIVPFLILAVIYCLAAENWCLGRKILTVFYSLPVSKKLNLKSSKALEMLALIWAIVGFISLAKFGYLGAKYLDKLDTWKANREAIQQVTPDASVLTTANLAPHLSHRLTIELTNAAIPPNLNSFDYILLNTRYPGWNSNSEFAQDLVRELYQLPQFELSYLRDDVYLFNKII
ncbi:MAG: DUF2079 domain-containing protein [Microcoleaceae cyanobacterium]